MLFEVEKKPADIPTENMKSGTFDQPGICQ